MSSLKIQDAWQPKSYPIPEHWDYVGLDVFFKNISLSNKKLPQKDYLESGDFPVIDQGVELVGGFSNDIDKVISSEVPVVVFGDHTKCFKYISFPFIPGADGIKVLQPKSSIYPKYAFYACQSLRLPDRGYSRHFSFLKKSRFPLAPIDEQRSIVAKIEELFSELDSGIASLKTAQQQLKIYRQALLKHAFEGKLTKQWRKDNASKLETSKQLFARIQQEREARYQQQLEEWKQEVKAWEEIGKEGRRPRKPKKPETAKCLLKSDVQSLSISAESWSLYPLGTFIERIVAGKSFKCEEREPNDNEVGVAKVSAVTWGEYDEAESKTCTDPSRINPEYFIQAGDFIFSRANTIELVGACVIAKKVTKNIMLSDKTLRIDLVDINKNFVLHYLRSQAGRKEIMERSTGNQESMRNIGQARIKSIVMPVCSLSEQQEIVNQLEEKLSIIEKNEKEVENALAKAELLRQSILKKAFSGKLN